MKLKKTFVKIISIIGAAVLSLTAVGCGNENNNQNLNDPNSIQIYYWKSGYGETFMQKMVDEFNKRQDKYTAYLDYDSSAPTILGTLNLGDSNTYDLYFTMLQNRSQMRDAIELIDILDYTAPGETKTIREKYVPEVLASQRDYDGKFRTLTYGSGFSGIIYNRDLLADDEVPRTTDELKEVVFDLAGQKIKPWLFYNENMQNGYWNYVMLEWAAQYCGADYYYNTMLHCGVERGEQPDKEFIKNKDGRYEALKVLESVLTPETVHPEITSTNFTKVQSLFLQGQSAMIVNGNWISNENKKSGNIAMMKTPLISSITDRLNDKTMSDMTLREIVSEVDNGAESSTRCSQEDFDIIKEARNMIYINSCREYTFIPKYSPAIEAAKEFLKFFYSDDGLLIFTETLGLPATVEFSNPDIFDESKLTGFSKNQFELKKILEPITYTLDQSAMFNSTGMDIYMGLTYAKFLCASNPRDRKTADDLWADLERNVETNWEDWV